MLSSPCITFKGRESISPRFLQCFLTRNCAIVSSIKLSCMWITLLMLALSAPLSFAGETLKQEAPPDQNVCAVALHPEKYRGARLTVRGRAYEALGRIYLRPPSCPETVRLVVSEGPIAPKSAQRIADFKRYLSARVRSRAKHTACPGCNRFRVEATVSGRVSLELQQAAGSVQPSRLVLSIDDVQGLEAEDLYGSFYNTAEYAPARNHGITPLRRPDRRTRIW
jgi:hypothetical protein